MKKLYLFLFTFFFSIISCQKNNLNCYLRMCIDWDKYQSTSTLNDTSVWKANKCWFNNQRDDGNIFIAFDFLNEFDELREKIRISDFDLTSDTILLNYERRGSEPKERKATSYFDTYVADGDASTESYDLFKKEGFKNFVKINSISDDGKEIEGVYQLAFIFSEDSPSKFDKSRPDTLIFTDGVFKARQIE